MTPFLQRYIYPYDNHYRYFPKIPQSYHKETDLQKKRIKFIYFILISFTFACMKKFKLLKSIKINYINTLCIYGKCT